MSHCSEGTRWGKGSGHCQNGGAGRCVVIGRCRLNLAVVWPGHNRGLMILISCWCRGLVAAPAAALAALRCAATSAMHIQFLLPV